MASLVKMSILGLRNFGADERDRQVVTFNSPLTLILGQNGCGKTTIIEALKYATSGEVPSNTNMGSGFVHDPKIDNRVEVRGQVKLVCKSTKGEQICIARSVQVQQKLKKLVFKSLDATITRFNPDTDEKESLSTRCADVDSEMCYRLGVTKPILNYVIFCHQEDSCWPLEENKKLKEKFDAIFDATKYNRCLDSMRKMVKDMNHEIKIKESNVRYLQKFEEEARQKRRTLEETTTKLTQTNEEILELEETLKPIKERYKEIRTKEEACNRLDAKRKKLEGRLAELQKTKEALRSAITKLFEGTDEELQAAIDSFDQDFGQKKGELAALQSERTKLSNDQQRIQNEIGTKLSLEGRLKQGEESYQKTIVERNKDITILANKLELPALNATQMSATGTDTTEKLNEIKTRVEERNEMLEAINVSQKESEVLIQEKINTCLENKAKNEQEIKSKKAQLQETKDEHLKVTNDINDADQSANTLIILQSKLARVTKELEDFSQSVNLADLEKQIASEKERKDQLGDEIRSLEEELEQLRAIRDDQMKLEDLRTSKLDQEQKVRKLKNKHGETLEHLLGEVPEQGIKNMFQDRLRRLSRDIEAKKKMLKDVNDKLINLRANKKNKAEKLTELENDLRAKETEINELCEDKDFDTLLNEISDDIQKKQDLKGTWYGTEYLYNKYIKKLAQPNPCCPLCHRDFDSEGEATELAEELKNNVSRIPQQSLDVAKQLDTLLAKKDRLLQLKPTIAKVQALKEIEIPALKVDVADNQQEIEKLQREHDSMENELVQPQKDEEMANNANNDIIELDRLVVELRALERKITDLEAKLGTKSKGVSYEQVSEELKRKREERDEVSKSVDNNQTKLLHQSNKLNEMRETKNKLFQEQLDLRNKSDRRDELVNKQKELQDLIDKVRKELDEKEEQLQPLSLELASLKKELEDAQKQHRKTLREESDIVSDLEKKLERIKQLQSTIDDYEKQGGAAKLSKVREEINELERQKSDLEQEEMTLMFKISDVDKSVSNLETSRKDLNSNKTLRSKNIEEQEYQKQFAELTEQLQGMNAVQLKEDREKCVNEEEKIKRKINQAQGRSEELRNNIKSVEKELRADNYKNAEANYKNHMIELKVQTLAMKDVGNYILALDWAMIHFHKERMKTINLIIRNLWRQIYSGNDIDTIEIKTEESDGNAAAKRRTYNYRVVCRRGDIEMDMRGRCSAGQKVLACLIIRMALAETFSKNCGILALDEPTTNLDQENIDSLSTALADIIAHHARQKNFQLIVITHDEDFLMRLSHGEKIPSYLKVQRNQHGKSEVVEVKVN